MRNTLCVGLLVFSSLVGFYGWSLGSNVACVATHIITPTFIAGAIGVFLRQVSISRKLTLVLGICLVSWTAQLIGYAVLGDGIQNRILVWIAWNQSSTSTLVFHP